MRSEATYKVTLSLSYEFRNMMTGFYIIEGDIVTKGGAWWGYGGGLLLKYEYGNLGLLTLLEVVVEPLCQGLNLTYPQ